MDVQRNSQWGAEDRGPTGIRPEQVLFVVAGLIAGLLLMTATASQLQACPPAAEGGTLCNLRQDLLRPLTGAALGGIAGHVLGLVVLSAIPQFVGHIRAGDRLRLRRRAVAAAPGADPVLVAASWGRTDDIGRTNGISSPPSVPGRASAEETVRPQMEEQGQRRGRPKRRRALDVCLSCLTIVEGAKPGEVCPMCDAELVRPPRVPAYGTRAAAEQTVEAPADHAPGYAPLRPDWRGARHAPGEEELVQAAGLERATAIEPTAADVAATRDELGVDERPRRFQRKPSTSETAAEEVTPRPGR